jgi:acetyl-CoA carboxylase biotin carboxyl carrier protein
MDLKEIQELIKIVDESKLTTLELEQEGFKIVLKKETEKIVTKEVVQGSFTGGYINADASPILGSIVPTGLNEKNKHAITGTPELAANHTVINSPIVGTFYSSSSPGDAPFVTKGDRVKKGTTLCIIEAMKLMNEIEADEDLQIIDIMVQDGQMVEYGQPLFIVTKA